MTYIWKRVNTNSEHENEMPIALIVACTAYHIDKFTWGQIRVLQKMGFEVHVAASFNVALSGNSSAAYVERCREKFVSEGIKVLELPFTRFPVSLKNFKALRLLSKQLGKYSYRLMHCHTPTGGLFARIAAARRRKKGLSVVYTAHGFHFFRGAPLLNWLLYYPVEWCLARITDCLIVINSEDERIAHKLPVDFVARINGAGVSRESFDNSAPINKADLGLLPEAFVFLCVGELSKRKNQELLIRGFAAIAGQCPDAVLVLAGEGAMRVVYKQLADSLGLAQRVFFLGWRDDVPALVLMADVIVSASKQEGLPVSLIEALVAGKPVIATPCRGNSDLAEQAGIIANGEKEFSEAMALIYKDEVLRAYFAQSAMASSYKYESRAVDGETEKLYLRVII